MYWTFCRLSASPYCCFLCQCTALPPPTHSPWPVPVSSRTQSILFLKAAWAFNDSVHASTANEDTNFALFMEIFDQYIKDGSPFEVNIDSKTKSFIKTRTNMETFKQLPLVRTRCPGWGIHSWPTCHTPLYVLSVQRPLFPLDHRFPPTLRFFERFHVVTVDCASYRYAGLHEFNHVHPPPPPTPPSGTVSA